MYKLSNSLTLISYYKSFLILKNIHIVIFFQYTNKLAIAVCSSSKALISCSFCSQMFSKDLFNVIYLQCKVDIAELEKIQHRNGSPFRSRLWSQVQSGSLYSGSLYQMVGVWINMGMRIYKSLNLCLEWQPFLTAVVSVLCVHSILFLSSPR